jgi:hypothetical protein
MSYNDGAPQFKSHSSETSVYHHAWEYLPSHASGSHTHTLNAGLHTFPFRLSLPPDLPPSLRNHTGTAVITYKLKATASRGFGSSNTTVKKEIWIARGLKPDALEYNSTVDLGALAIRSPLDKPN